jgi:hypothetical protein
MNSKTVLNKREDNGAPSLVPDLRETGFMFPHLV